MKLNEYGWLEEEHSYKGRRILIKSKKDKGMKAVVHYNNVHEFTLRFVFILPEKLLRKTKNKIDRHNLLFESWAWCDWKDKSTEFMISFMMDTAGVNHNYIMNFIRKYSKHRQTWYNNNKNWYKNYE